MTIRSDPLVRGTMVLTRIAVHLIVPSTLGPIADANPQPHPCWVYRVSCWQGVPWEDETALLLLGGLLWSFVSW